MKKLNITKNIFSINPASIAAFSFFLFPVFTSAQWEQQTSGTTLNLHSVYFTDTSNGWASGGWWTSAEYGIILHTDDGGNTWEEQISGTSEYISAVYFTNSTYGWAVGNNDDGSTIYRTANGGSTWEEDELFAGRARGLYFTDQLNGWAVGDAILHTTDGGETWEAQLYLTGNAFSVCFTDSLNGWVSGGYGIGSTGFFYGYILHTIDGGNNWDYQFDYGSREGYILFDICFTDSLKGWSSGGGWGSHGGKILKTTDGGNNWDTSYYDHDNPGRLYAVSFADQFNGWAVGAGGRIISTTDGGITWVTEQSATNQDLNSICFIENGFGWAVGDSGTILHADYSQTVGMDKFIVQSSKSKIRNYPNPFSTSTTIEFESAQSTQIVLSIYNQLGELIEVLQKTSQPGKQTITWDANGLPSGVYFIRMRFENELITRKMIKL